jgi:hypothetical protein
MAGLKPAAFCMLKGCQVTRLNPRKREHNER